MTPYSTDLRQRVLNDCDVQILGDVAGPRFVLFACQRFADGVSRIGVNDQREVPVAGPPHGCGESGDGFRHRHVPILFAVDGEDGLADLSPDRGLIEVEFEPAGVSQRLWSRHSPGADAVAGVVGWESPG